MKMGIPGVPSLRSVGSKASVSHTKWTLSSKSRWVSRIVHTCHISQCEIKSDKISQNFAHLEANSHKKFKSHRIFRPSYTTFYEEMNINHTLLYLSQASYILIKAFNYSGGAPVIFVKISQNFIKSPLKICLISQISVRSLRHVWNTEIRTSLIRANWSEELS